jgi:hypothetical protein
MAHPHAHQTRTSARLANPGGPLSASSQILQAPAPTPILKPSEVKRQFSQHADYQAYARAVKKFLSGSITKTEFHAELSKILPTKEKRTPKFVLPTTFISKLFDLELELTELLRPLLSFVSYDHYAPQPPIWLRNAVALHNWLILSILKSAYSDYHAQKKGVHATGSGGPSHKTPNLRSISDHFAFKKRMQRTIAQNQLSGVSDDAVSMVVVALQQHLLRTLAALRSDHTVNPEQEDVPEDMQVAETSVPGDISSNDISGAFWRRPTVLCENASLIQHRLAVEQ